MLSTLTYPAMHFESKNRLPMNLRIFSTALICVGVHLMIGSAISAISAGLILAALAKIQDNQSTFSKQ